MCLFIPYVTAYDSGIDWHTWPLQPHLNESRSYIYIHAHSATHFAGTICFAMCMRLNKITARPK